MTAVSTDFRTQLDRLIDRDELTRMMLEMVDIPSPTGGEEGFARYLGQRFGELGMEIKYQEVEPGRPNMVARLKGTGGGATPPESSKMSGSMAMAART